MYDPSQVPRVARRQTEPIPGRDPAEAARRALERVRRTLTAFRPGLPLDAAALRAALSCALLEPAAEAERQFALGWLFWLEGDFAQAETSLTSAIEQSEKSAARNLPAECKCILFVSTQLGKTLRVNRLARFPCFGTGHRATRQVP